MMQHTKNPTLTSGGDSTVNVICPCAIPSQLAALDDAVIETAT